MLFSGRAYPDLAYEVAHELRTERVSTELREFANGEIYVRFVESVRGSDTFLSGDAAERLEQAGPAQLVITDTLPGPASVSSGGPAVRSNAPLLVRAVSEVFQEGSMTSLSEGGS
ncbi:ribose-phosphate pyrophosphokinase-like domain-containing protein [Nonomuraea wenchangensis]